MLSRKALIDKKIAKIEAALDKMIVHHSNKWNFADEREKSHMMAAEMALVGELMLLKDA